MRKPIVKNSMVTELKPTSIVQKAVEPQHQLTKPTSNANPTPPLLPGIFTQGQDLVPFAAFPTGGVSKAAARLLAKTAHEKLKSVQDDRLSKELKQKADNNKDNIAAREKEFQRLEAEKLQLKGSKTKIRVTLLAMKHLPKMDKFGKTDAYCIFNIDNRSAGGQNLKRKSTVVKRNLNPEWKEETFYFDIFDYPSQELRLECWDWDGSGKDEFFGQGSVLLEDLKEQERVEKSIELSDRDKKPVFGHDASRSLVKVAIERNVQVSESDKLLNSVLGDSDETRVLDCTSAPWESSCRGLMFDIDNKSDFPVLISGMQAAAGRGKSGNCSYTIYRTPGTWKVGRCPCNSLSPCKYCWLCCGSCPSGRPNFQCMKCCCRCTPAGNERIGCCCWGECGEGRELAEPCCEGCIPCCTGRFAINPIIIPCFFPLLSFGCGCCTGEKFGGAGSPGIPAVGLWRCNGCKCCRNGVHRQAPDCKVCCIPCYCSCNSTCCHCCRKKYFDRRRWTRVTSGWVDLPSDWGEFGALPTFKDFEGGGILIPPKQKVAIYIHSSYPENQSGEYALAIRGPYTRGYNQGDVADEDNFIRVRTGPQTLSRIPFASSDLARAEDDGQYYKLGQELLQEYSTCAFVGKIEYQVLPKSAVPRDCLTLCGACPSIC